MLEAKASLVIVGSGIKFVSHLTTEAKAYIEQSDKVLYLLNEPVLKTWIHKIHSNSESLDQIYTNYPFREQSYSAITDYILQTVYQNQHVCVVFYGHPSIFVKPARNAVIQAKQEGYFAKILPGISAEDCLFADLLVDPASDGCLSLDATDLLIHHRKIDVTCHVVLWQVSVIGMLGHDRFYDNSKGLNMLFHYLTRYYPLEHELISYSASQYPGLDPMIKKFKLEELNAIKFSRTSTLYIPPLNKPLIDKNALIELNLHLADVQNN